MGQPRVCSDKAGPHQPVLIHLPAPGQACLLPSCDLLLPCSPCPLLPQLLHPSSPPATPSTLTRYHHPGPVTRAKLGPCCGVFPLLLYANPSLHSKSLPGDRTSPRLQALPATLVPAAAWDVGRMQSDLRDAELVRALPFQGAQAAASGSQGARGEGLGHGWQGHGHPCSKNHRNM